MGEVAPRREEIHKTMAIAVNKTKAAITSSSRSNISTSSRHSHHRSSINTCRSSLSKSSAHRTPSSNIISDYPKRISSPCVCFRYDQPGHFRHHNDSRVIPPTPINTYSAAPSHSAPLGESRVANYLFYSLGNFIYFTEGNYGRIQQQQMHSLPPPCRPPAPSESFWNSSID